MTSVRVASFAISIDGFGAGPKQSLENPLGEGGLKLHEWFFPTNTFQKMHVNAKATGTTGVDDDFAIRGLNNIGAWILGRNMFAPSRGAWTDMNWKGWWGDNPPYHTPVFVLTHYPRETIVMEGGTTFYFVTDGIYSALERAKEAAKGLDVRIGGGVETIKQYLRAGLIDEMHIAISPILLGSGEHLFSGIDLLALGYYCVESTCSSNATHMIIKRKI